MESKYEREQTVKYATGRYKDVYERCEGKPSLTSRWFVTSRRLDKIHCTITAIYTLTLRLGTHMNFLVEACLGILIKSALFFDPWIRLGEFEINCFLFAAKVLLVLVFNIHYGWNVRNNNKNAWLITEAHICLVYFCAGEKVCPLGHTYLLEAHILTK